MDPEQIPPRFDFARDRFAFANELVWEYQLDPASGKMNFLRRKSKPGYAHRCFVLARAARQFLYHAVFDPKQSMPAEAAYRGLVREVFSRSPRSPSAAERRILFPGHANLREFSAKQEQLLKSEGGGAWRSYVLRSHWRMIFPISRAHQKATSARLIAAVEKNLPPIVHLVKFPSLTINHGMLVFDHEKTPQGFEFLTYDPNDPLQPGQLNFNAATGTFSLPPNRYWKGGELNVIEIYRNWFL
jgi:hypothetical protein